MSGVIVDTDVVSFGFRGDSRFADYERHLDGKIALISFMTFAELLRGSLHSNWGERRRSSLISYVKQHYAVAYVTQDTCFHWAALHDQASKKGRVLATPDGWIAATAASLGVPLVTNNARDFGYLDGIAVITEARL